jgi:hypothetical protein
VSAITGGRNKLMWRRETGQQYEAAKLGYAAKKGQSAVSPMTILA